MSGRAPPVASLAIADEYQPREIYWYMKRIALCE